MAERKSDVIWRVLDREFEIDISYRDRPHWDQQGALTFVTCRLNHSIPAPVLRLWLQQQADWLRSNGGHVQSIEAAMRQGVLPNNLLRQFLKMRSQEWHRHVDRCYGSCLLRTPRFAKIVAESLLYFDGERDDVERLVVMPNHFHVLVQMRPGWTLKQQCGRWMSYTSRRINQILGRRGSIWQSEPFDHVVRSEEQFAYLRQYILDNPVKANLRAGEFLVWIRSNHGE